MPIVFSDDEVETVRKLIKDWGFEYALQADAKKVEALANRIDAPNSLLAKMNRERLEQAARDAEGLELPPEWIR